MDLRHVAYMSRRLLYLALTPRQTWQVFLHFNAEVAYFMMPAPARTLMEARDLVLDTVEVMARGGMLTVSIHDRVSGEFLGATALNGIGSPTPELGVWLKREAWGHSYGREAIGAIMAWYQREHTPEYYLYPVDGRNRASVRIAQYFGGQALKYYRTTNAVGRELQVAEFHIPPLRLGR